MFSPETFAAYNTKAAMAREEGRTTEARDILHHGLRAARLELGEDHETTLSILHNYGALLTEMGSLSEAEPMLQEALTNRREVLGAVHKDTCATMANLAVLLHQRGKLDAEIELRKELLAARRTLAGDDKKDKSMLAAMGELAAVYVELDRLEDAIPLVCEEMEGYVALLGRSCKSYVPQASIASASSLYSKLTERKDGNTMRGGARLMKALMEVVADRKPIAAATASDAATGAATGAAAGAATGGDASATIRASLEALSEEQLKQACAKLGLSDDGGKEDLMARVLEQVARGGGPASPSPGPSVAAGAVAPEVPAAAVASAPSRAPEPAPLPAASAAAAAAGGGASDGTSLICALLRGVGLEQYVPTFEEEDMDLSVMQDALKRQGRSAVDEVLKELGVKTMGHRTKIINALATA